MKHILGPELLRRAGKIKLIAMDVDGVLTGGEIIILNSGEEVKIWSVKDRLGFALLKRSAIPIKLIWITARKSLTVERTAKDLKIDFVFQKCINKWETLKTCAQSLGIKTSEIAYIGDDLVDLEPLKNCGFSVCPPESHLLLKKVCHYQTKTSAGKGVAREVIEMILEAKGKLKETIAKFCLLLLVGIFLSGCYGSQKQTAQATEVPDQWVENFTITETKSGVPVWILDSENAQVFNKEQKVVLDNIRIKFMNPAGVKGKQSRASLMLAKAAQTLAARMSAPKGKVNTLNNDLTAWGGVEVLTQDGSKLYAQDLTYSTARQKIFTESPVKIVRKDSILMGEGMEATPDLSQVKVFKHRSEIYPKQLESR